jgi:MFS family permease
LVLNLPALLLGLFCGAWSDRVGRKIPVMLSSFGTIVAVLFYMLSLFFITSESAAFIALLFVGAAIRGAFGKATVITMAMHR